jgi:hypothetical protein
MRIHLLLPAILLSTMPALSQAEDLKSTDHPDVAALALSALESHCDARKVQEFKSTIGQDGFKFDVREREYRSYKVLEVLAQTKSGAIYMVTDFDRTGAPESCHVTSGPLAPASAQ